jgi:hypothetical protein
MFIFSLVLALASVLVIPVAVRAGMSATAANRIPLFGFVLGLALGMGVNRSRNVKQAVLYFSSPLLFGAVGWFLGLLAGAVLMLFGASESLVDRVPVVGFGLGVALGIVPLFAVGWDVVGRVGAEREKREGAKSQGERTDAR